MPLLLSSVAWAADITGQVIDPSGASVPRARVEVLDTGGAKLQTAVTDNGGRFAFNGLAPGKYILHVESDLFEAATADVEATEGAPAIPVISLKLKQVKGQVEVSSRSESLTVPDAADAQQKLDGVAGNVSEIPADQYRGSAIISMDDALSQTPGVYAEPKGRRNIN